MDIISAIDLKHGKIVKAFAGFRINYKPLIINKKDYSDPYLYVKAIIEKLNYKYIYIADLDSIIGSRENWKIVRNVILTHPEINFIIDLGFDCISKVSDFQNYLNSEQLLFINWRPVIGSETLKKNDKILFSFAKKNAFFSLDFNGSENFWIDKVNFFFSETIFMFVRQVGGRGVNWVKLNSLRNYFKPSQSIIAGGIRYWGDITKLKRLGYKGVIISTLIHNQLK